MKNYLLHFLIFIVLIIQIPSAQVIIIPENPVDTDTTSHGTITRYEYKKNNINIELLGLCDLYTVNYERDIHAFNQRNHLWIRLGIGGLYLSDISPNMYRNSLATEKIKYWVAVPASVYYSGYFGRHRFEFGLGLSFQITGGTEGSFKGGLVLVPLTSYRKILRNEKMFFQGSFYPLIEDGSFALHTGFSFGVYFR